MANFPEIPKFVLSPEGELLLCCARMNVDSVATTRVRSLLEQGIDWDTLLQLTFDHEVTALLYRSLEALGKVEIPEHIRTELKHQIQADLQGNLSLTKELLRLMSLFDEHAISAIPYKGPLIAAAVYRDLTARPFGDLDILVSEQDVLPAIELLVSDGYEVIRPRTLTQLDKNLQSLWMNRLVKRSPWAYQVILWNEHRKALVELHWQILPAYVFPNEYGYIRQELMPVLLGSTRLPTFSPENLLWFLCLHAAKHQWKKLRYLCDIAELIRSFPDLNWETLIERAKTLGIERRVYLGLFMAKQLLMAPLPAEIEAKIQAMPQRKKLSQQVLNGFFSGEKPKFSAIRQLSFQLSCRDGIRDRVKYLLRYFRYFEILILPKVAFLKSFSLLDIRESVELP